MENTLAGIEYRVSRLKRKQSFTDITAVFINKTEPTAALRCYSVLLKAIYRPTHTYERHLAKCCSSSISNFAPSIVTGGASGGRRQRDRDSLRACPRKNSAMELYVEMLSACGKLADTSSGKLLIVAKVSS